MSEQTVLGGEDAAALAEEIDALSRRVSAFIRDLDLTVDDVEIWLYRRTLRGCDIKNHILVPLEERSDDVVIRVHRDGKVGEVHVQSLSADVWREAVVDGLASARASVLPPPRAPTARRPGPMTFDPDLADYLARERELARVSEALVDNTWHEGTRGGDLRTVSGRVAYRTRRYVLGNRRGVVSSLHGEMSARVELNGIYGDVFHQTHAPESFLPLALLGARTWRTMPRSTVTPDRLGLSGRVPVVLHPRLLERLIRVLGPAILSADARSTGVLPFDEGERVAGLSVTLVDDSGLDGMAASRPFDDEGVPVRHTPIVVRGRLSEVLCSRSDALATGGRPSGNVWRGRFEALDEAPNAPALGFGSLLMERGELGFHDMVGAVEKTVLIQEFDSLEIIDANSSAFRGTVRWGVSLERGSESRLLAPKEWSVSGHLFSLPGYANGLLEDVVFSRELYDTGTAIVPYCLGFLNVDRSK